MASKSIAHEADSEPFQARGIIILLNNIIFGTCHFIFFSIHVFSKMLLMSGAAHPLQVMENVEIYEFHSRPGRSLLNFMEN